MNDKIWFVDPDQEGKIQPPPELLRGLAIGPGSELTLIMMNRSVYIHPACQDDAVSEGPLPDCFYLNNTGRRNRRPDLSHKLWATKHK